MRVQVTLGDVKDVWGRQINLWVLVASVQW